MTSAALARAAARTSSALPLPMKKRGSGRSRRPVTVATGSAPAETRQLLELLQILRIDWCAKPQAHEYGALTAPWALEHSGFP